jgi:phage I-like protein
MVNGECAVCALKSPITNRQSPLRGNMATTKEGYPPSDFLVVEDPEKATTFHLQVRRHGKPDHGLMGAAFAALFKNYRGNTYEGPGKEQAKSKLRALYKSEGMDWPSETNSELGIVNSELRTETAGSPFTIHHSPFPRFVALLADVPGTGLIRIPIAVTGSWAGAEKKFSIELEDLEQIRENFAKKPTGEINVDYEHASEVPFGTGGPVLSAGRITKLDEPEKFRNGNRELGMGKGEGANSQLPTPNSRFILWGWFEPTERARELIANREYRYISPAIRWGTKDKVSGKTAGTALTSVALVNKPFLEELPEIHLCEIEDSVPLRAGRIQDSGKAASRTFVSLQQLHVPGPVNQVSVAYQQPKMDSAGRSMGSGAESRILNPESLSAKETTMAKSLKLKCLTDAHLEKHDLPAEHKGKIGVFDGEELIGVADGPEGWEPTEAPQDQFAALSESIHDGKINLVEAGKLADAGRVRFSTILQAQEAERKVNAAVKAGKVLPKNRAHALKLALSDATGFSALVEQARPVVDLRSHGHAGGGEATTAQQALMAEVNAYAKENKCSVSVALSEVTKRKPDLWREYSEEIVAVSQAAEEEVE